MEKKTPLYQTHVDMGGKIVEFGGFLMPVQYPTGVIAEHMAVREKAGLFDVSHMGELRLKGPDAVANVQKIITSDISNMKDGEIKYSMFCNDNGGIIDDFIVYRCAADNYWLEGIGIAVEKGFQGGGDRFRASGIPYKALAVIEKADENGFVFREE